MRLRTVLALLLVSPFLGAQSGVPELTEDVVIGLHPFSGRDYLQATFSHSARSTIYLAADSNNFLRVLKTLVYYWPVTDEWRTDTETLNYAFDGTLIISESRNAEPLRIEPTPYAYFSVPGRYEAEVVWQVVTGDAAFAELDRVRGMVDAYTLEQQARIVRARELQDSFNALLPEISRRRQAGEDIAPLVAEAEAIDARIRALRTPPQPPWEEVYVTPPQRVETGYVVNLPAGRFAMHFEDDRGRTLEGSQKEVIVFAPTRVNTLGYQILPGDSYTVPVDSTEPGSVIFIDGSAEFYVRVYSQNEYNDLYHARMVDQDAQGNPNVRRWVRVRELADATITVSRRGQDDLTVQPVDYRVRQTPGATLGYTILPFQPEGSDSGGVPSFRAVRLDPADLGRRAEISILAQAEEDHGERHIRVVRVPSSIAPLLLLALVPFGAFALFTIRRRRYLARIKHSYGEE